MCFFELSSCAGRKIFLAGAFILIKLAQVDCNRSM